MDALPRLLRAWRERALLTQQQLAEGSGLGVRTIRRLESPNAPRPRGESIKLLADTLRLDDFERAQLLAACRGEPVAEAGRFEGTSRIAGPHGDHAPRQLPPGVAGFTGRGEYLAELDRLVRDDADVPRRTVVAVIAGMAGVGKTTLAVHWAHGSSARFPDGQLYADLRGFHPEGRAAQPADVVRAFLDALAVRHDRVPRDLDARVALYRSVLAGRRMLILLDNAADPAQVRPLLPGAPGCMAVVTSRDQLAGLVTAEGAHLLTLEPFSVAEAHEMLRHRIGEDRLTTEPAAAGELIALSARLPLALAVTAARANTHRRSSLTSLAEEVRQTRHRLSAFETGDTATEVRGVFSWSYERLGAEAARLFRMLGLNPGKDISIAGAASLAGKPPQRVRTSLRELERLHLVARHTPGRYALHDLLHLYAADLAAGTDSGEVRRAAARRLLDHHLHSALAADRVLYPARDVFAVEAPLPGVTVQDFTDDGEAMRWFATEHAALMAATEQAARLGFDTHCWHLAWAAATFLERRGHWRDWIGTQSAALAAALRLDDRLLQAAASRSLGRARIATGHLDEARKLLRRALELADRLGDKVNSAHAHVNLSQIAEAEHRWAEAIAHCRQALELYTSANHLLGQANALNSMGWFQAHLGDYRNAIANCGRALALHRTIGNRAGQSASSDSLGLAHLRLGQYAQAETFFRQAAGIAHGIGDRYREALSLVQLGDAHLAQGGRGAARQEWRRALTIYTELEHPAAALVREKLAQTGRSAGLPTDGQR